MGRNTRTRGLRSEPVSHRGFSAQRLSIQFVLPIGPLNKHSSGHRSCEVSLMTSYDKTERKLHMTSKTYDIHVHSWLFLHNSIPSEWKSLLINGFCHPVFRVICIFVILKTSANYEKSEIKMENCTSISIYKINILATCTYIIADLPVNYNRICIIR